MLDHESFETLLTLDLARRSRDLHGVTMDGTCLYCFGPVSWPCEPFERAQTAIETLTARDSWAWFDSLPEAPDAPHSP